MEILTGVGSLTEKPVTTWYSGFQVGFSSASLVGFVKETDSQVPLQSAG